MRNASSVRRADRRRLEEVWRTRLDEARRRYDWAKEGYRRLLDRPPGVPLDSDSEAGRARQAESEALAEYSRVLQVFTRLAIDGELPEEQPVPSLIVVIDDDESVRDAMRALLRSAGHRVETFASAEAFLESGTVTETACLVLDVRMPGMDGPELQLRLSAGHSRIPIVFITAHAEKAVRERVMQAGALEVLSKPFVPNALLSLVGAALDRGSEPFE